MNQEDVVYVATCDLSGQVRGKGRPARAFKDGRSVSVGWVPTNSMITCFDTIADGPFGSLGDLVLRADPQARVDVDFGDGQPRESFALGNIDNLDGSAWSCCPRSILQKALAHLASVSGLQLSAAFEHEFQLPGSAKPAGAAFGLAGFRAHQATLSGITAAIRSAGFVPDSILREYGADQFEVTVKPESGVRAADAAVVTRELVRAVALRCGETASFTPIRDVSDVGNGVHVHMSLQDADGRTVMYDPNGQSGFSAQAGAFVAGILRHLSEIVALTAPSVISYQRLTPHRWSAAFNNLGVRDREAGVRLCPVRAGTADAMARQFHVEYRAADAAASPYLALAALIHAGAQGLEEGLPTPTPSEGDLDALDAAALSAMGVERLPESLEAALARFAGSEAIASWFGEEFQAVYVAHKQGEMAHVSQMDDAAMLAAYSQVY